LNDIRAELFIRGGMTSGMMAGVASMMGSGIELVVLLLLNIIGMLAYVLFVQT